MSLRAEAFFGKRWVLNSLMNLRETLRTPSIFSKQSFFSGKPVIIASAGPSLHEEYDRLRYIKEKGLAYIVAVGSANKALVANDILPHAVCTYDPQDHNFGVFSEMIAAGKDVDVPMIYGTSVGYETIERYRGPKLHMVTTQDTVTPYYHLVPRTHVVDDAFSIAIVTFQLFAKMGASPIIFVGQNLAFLENLYYANDIKRGPNQTAEVLDFEKHGLTFVEDVHGNKIMTNASLNQMRWLLEQYIQTYEKTEVINATKRGAKIVGTTFIPLEQLIATRLKERVVDEQWYKYDFPNEDIRFTEKIQETKKGSKKLIALFALAVEQLKELTEAEKLNKKQKIVRTLDRFYNSLQRMLANDFFRVYIAPAMQAQLDVLIRYMESDYDDVSKKAKELIPLFNSYLSACLQMFNELSPVVTARLQSYAPKDDGWTCRFVDEEMFQFSSEWEKRDIAIGYSN